MCIKKIIKAWNRYISWLPVRSEPRVYSDFWADLFMTSITSHVHSARCTLHPRDLRPLSCHVKPKWAEGIEHTASQQLAHIWGPSWWQIQSGSSYQWLFSLCPAHRGPKHLWNALAADLICFRSNHVGLKCWLFHTFEEILQVQSAFAAVE